MSFTSAQLVRLPAPNAVASPQRVWRLLALTCLLALLAGCVTSPLPPSAGPWDMRALGKTPAVTWGETNGLVQELYYEGEPWNGKATRVFA